MKMKKRDLKKLALMGLTGGIALSNSAQANEFPSSQHLNIFLAAASTSTSTLKSDPNDGNLGYHLMNEDELLLELNEEGQRQYHAMDNANKKLAREVASARCGNTNQCKGLNACKTETHACAGKGSCKAQGKCAIADKNLAVKLVYDKMMKKRAEANGN
jgi:hypothetical protein